MQSPSQNSFELLVIQTSAPMLKPRLLLCAVFSTFNLGSGRLSKGTSDAQPGVAILKKSLLLTHDTPVASV